MVYVTEQRVQMYLHNNGALWKLTDKEKKKKKKILLALKLNLHFSVVHLENTTLPV